MTDNIEESKSRAESLDQYYTRSDVAQLCIDSLYTHINLKSDNILFVEPSAGAGVFFLKLPADKRIGLDLEPKHPEIHKVDFLEWSAEESIKNKNMVVSVGNPPFGQNSSLALQFINKCMSFSDAVGFVLPKTFKKLSMMNKVNRNFVLKHQFDLPKYSFEFEGVLTDVPCVFQIWIKSGVPRELPKPGDISHPDFIFCEKDKADFALRRVGRVAGRVLENFENYSKSSNFFIKSVIPKSELISMFKSIDWSDVMYNTAGNPSISKREIIAAYSALKPE